MQFSTVRGLVGWAFQMSEAVPVKVQKFAEAAQREYGALTPDELKAMAVDILAKISRLPEKEQAALAAYFTADTRAIKRAAALILPRGWNQPLRIELARCWANDEQLERTQREMAETYMLSEATMTRRKQDAFAALGGTLRTALEVLEVQLLDLLRHPSRANAHRWEPAAA
ncbi:hypothetical protein JFK97_06710 [Chromobacterium phragmitis]|uniref:hypothetical protein n=1 Tax=Chromobacterium amazonense TaxID=1382803 RepID=UPI0021B6FDD5|nr:hypothetical protein [Chromobacterium amazonense]MBM2884078.1 hypothetical protein [Chromobacterium amazonense]